MAHRLTKTAWRRGLLLAFGAAQVFLSHTGSGSPGDLYEADLGSGTIFRFFPDGTKSSFASGLVAPVGIAFDGKGNAFVSDTGGGSVVQITSDGKQSVFAAIPDGPTGLAIDSAGNLFVAVFNTGVILKFAPDGTQSTFVSGLTSATGLAFDKEGNLFAADLSSGTIYKITQGGVKTAFATNLSGPGGLAFDGSGNLFAADNISGLIYKFSSDGTASTFASGISGAAGIVFASDGNLFVASNLAGTISKFTPSAAKSIFASGLNGSTFLAFEPLPQKLLNTSARALVLSGDNALIAGFIVGGSSLVNNGVVIRALGPSLAQAGVANPLSDPTLELLDSTGAVIASNDNWHDTQQAQISDSGFAPSDPRESVILTQLPSGEYTAVVRGANSTTGLALVEIYNVP